MRTWEFRYRAMLSDRPRDVGDDGDTVLMLLDQGMGSRAEEAIRLAGVHAPERHQAGGAETAAFLKLVLDEIAERARTHRGRWAFEVRTEPAGKLEVAERRTFVRYVGNVWALDTGESVNMQIADFLRSHPEWGGGIGATEAAANG